MITVAIRITVIIIVIIILRYDNKRYFHGMKTLSVNISLWGFKAFFHTINILIIAVIRKHNNDYVVNLLSVLYSANKYRYRGVQI